jgi:hypothetical protein
MANKETIRQLEELLESTKKDFMRQFAEIRSFIEQIKKDDLKNQHRDN